MRSKSILVLLLFVLFNAFAIVVQFIGNNLGMFAQDAWYTWISENRSLFRPAGILNDPNLSATLTVSFFPVILFLFLKEKRRVFLDMQVIGIAILIIATLFTGSRLSWLFTAGLLSIVCFLYREIINNKIMLEKKVITIMLVLLVVVFIVSIPYVISRVTFENPISMEGGLGYRLKQGELGLRLFMKNIWTGVGLGTFTSQSTVSSYAMQIGLQPAPIHNFFVQIGAEMGVLGLVSFLGLLWQLAKKHSETTKILLRKKLISIEESLYFSLVLYILFMIIFPWYAHPAGSVFFWLLVTLNV
jgi:O-antigen ligase